MKRSLIVIISIYFLFSIIGCRKIPPLITQPETSNYYGWGPAIRFSVSGNNMFANGVNGLAVYDISTPENPKYLGVISSQIFLQSFSSNNDTVITCSQKGFQIFNLSDPIAPVLISKPGPTGYYHPVVRMGNLAYLTLHTYIADYYWTNGVNQFWAMDISDPYNPVLADSIGMTYPTGLSFVGKDLFVYDKGVKVFYGDSLPAFKLKSFNSMNINANEILTNGNDIVLPGEDGIYQYKYTGDSLAFLSKIPIQ